MTCPRCGTPVTEAQRAQPTRLAGFTKSWPALCDTCLRGGLWPGGSREALSKLIDGGDPDLAARARLAETHPSPFAGMARPDFTGALRAAAKAQGFELPDNLKPKETP